MRAIECGCGEHPEGADTAALLRAIRAHVARDHPGMPLTDPGRRRLHDGRRGPAARGRR